MKGILQKENKDNYFLYRYLEYHEEANTGKMLYSEKILKMN